MSGDTEGTADVAEAQVDALGMSDADFENLPLDAFEEPTTEAVDDNLEGGDLEAGEESTEEDVSTEETDLEETTEEDTDVEETSDNEVNEDADTSTQEDTSVDVDTKDTDTDDTGTEDEGTESDDGFNYKAEYQKLLAPFKANGKEVKVNNVDEAITLMQMGANYNKKMAGLKPSLKLLKMLEQNSLLDEGKLSYLIDLDKQNPDAIKKLVKDSKLDSMDLDDDTGEYKPNTYTVDENELALDQALGEIQDTESYGETLNIVGNKWDDTSKKILLENPTAIKTINDHVAMGIYPKIAAEVERQRMLGQLQGLSDIEAYKVTGEAINAAGGFNAQPDSNTDSTKTDTSKKATETQRKAKRKAASPTKAKGNKNSEPAFDPLSMSDDDFEKLNPNFT